MKRSLALLFLLLAACVPLPVGSQRTLWQYGDLLALDPAEAPSPTHDLIAAYAREQGDDLLLRLDLLEVASEPDYDIYLALDTGPGGSLELPLDAPAGLAWEVLVYLPAGGAPRALDESLRARRDLIPRVVRDPALDTVTVSLNRARLPAQTTSFRIEVFLTPAGALTPADQLGPVGLGAAPPLRAPVLLAFWNTFPAYTPAQALRRWDGAHTGPFGERHGLRVLLEAAVQFDVPVTLLDLKIPAFLPALDLVDALPLLQRLVARDLVGIPDVLPISHRAAAGQIAFRPPAEVLALVAAQSREAGLSFGLPASPALYAPLIPEPPSVAHRVIFIPPDTAPGAAGVGPGVQLLRWQGRTLVPIPESGVGLQATGAGPALEVRRELLESALHERGLWKPGGDRILVLGGDLTQSAWGDPQAARATLAYLAAHPWIRPLSPRDLLAVRPPTRWRATDESPTGGRGNGSEDPDLVARQALVLSALAEASPGPAREAAWQAYLALLAPNPPGSQALPALRANFLGEIGALLSAEAWSAAPAPQSRCDQDMDFDGERECILASATFWAAFETGGGRLTHAFARTPAGLAQVIGPYSQFVVGLGDPAAWDPTRGVAGDPGLVPGGFSGPFDPYSPSEPTPGVSSMTFSALDGSWRKVYQLAGGGLDVRVEITSGGRGQVQIPLALAPETRFAPGWGARFEAGETDGGIFWQIQAGPRASLTANTPLSLLPFNGAGVPLPVPEDPNFDYPAGHFIPLPLALVEAQVDGTAEFSLLVEQHTR